MLLVIGLYWPSISYGFVNWDDPWYILNNPLIKSWHPANLRDVATKIAIRNYAPVTLFSYLVEHTLWGEWAGGYHLTNFLLHAVNAVLVYFVVGQLTGSRFIAWATAALFAVHPVQLESVAWISSRKGLLSATFLLASLLYWFRLNRTPRDEMFGLVLYAISLFAKAAGIVLPAVVLAYDMFVRRVKFSDAVARQIIPGMLAVWLLMVTMGAQTTEIGGVRGHLEWSKVRIIAFDAVLLWQYIGMLAWPANLCVMYDPKTDGIDGLVAASMLAWTALAAIVWKQRGSMPLVMVAVFSFFAFLFPVLNFFPITTLLNDRYLYLPCIPVFALLAASVEWAVRWLSGCELNRFGFVAPWVRARRAVWCGYLTTTALVVLYAGMARQHLPVWQNSLALWSQAYERYPQMPLVRIQWAFALHEAGRESEAIAMLEGTLVESNPDDADRKRVLRKLDEWKSKHASASAPDAVPR